MVGTDGTFSTVRLGSSVTAVPVDCKATQAASDALDFSVIQLLFVSLLGMYGMTLSLIDPPCSYSAFPSCCVESVNTAPL